jgi:hypothetical protein
VAIVCDLPWNLQVTRIIPSTTNSHNFQCKQWWAQTSMIQA